MSSTAKIYLGTHGVRRLRVLLIGDDPKAHGGIATHLRILFEALQPHMDIRVFISGSPGRNEKRVRRFARRMSAPALLAFALLRCRPDAIHLNPSFDRKALFRDLAFAFVARAYRVPVLVQIHGGNTAQLLAGSVIDRCFSGLLLRLAGRILVLTERQRGPLIAAFPSLSARLIRAPNMAPPLLAREGGVPPVDGQYVLWLSRIVRGKGIFDLLDALSILRRDGLRCQLVIAGDGPERAAADSHMRAMGLAENVVFVGHIDGSKKANALASATALVLPSYLPEGLPYAILEAMSCGVPVIASAVGGIPEVVDDTTGILVPPRNPPALADALRRLLNDKALQQRLGQAAMRRASEEFGSETVTATFMRLYRELAETGGTRTRPGSISSAVD